MHRSVSVVPALLAALACGGPKADESGESELGDEWTATGSLDDDENTSDTVSGADTDSDGGEPPCDNEDCEVGEACVDDECVAIDELAACTPPVLAPLSLPSANGQIVALDLIDLDQDGADEILAWIDEMAIGVLDNLAWTKSEYLTEGFPAPTIAAIDVDGDTLLDLLLNQGDDPVEILMGDGAGHFESDAPFPVGFDGGRWLRRIELAPGRPHVFASPYENGHLAAYLRFDGPHPEVVLLGVYAGQPRPLALDVDHEAALFVQHCDAFAFRIDVDEDVHDITMAEISIVPQNNPTSCEWAIADFDGDARDDLVAFEPLYYAPDLPRPTLLRMFENQMQTQTPSFEAKQLAMVPSEHRSSVAGDLDGDGDDELLLLPETDGEATLVWIDADQPPGCAASIAGIPDDVITARAGDIDGDGDEEIALLRINGAMQVLDAN